MSVNKIHKTKLISFPRSGSDLLVRGLQTLLQGEIVYSNGTAIQNMENSPFVNLEKNQDLELKEPIDPNTRYIVLIREPEGAIRSWYRQESDNGLTTHYEDWAEEKMKFYQEWTDKWVKSEIPYRTTVIFESLLDQKITTVIDVAKFMMSEEIDYRHNIPYLGFWSHGENLLQRKYKHLKS